MHRSTGLIQSNWGRKALSLIVSLVGVLLLMLEASGQTKDCSKQDLVTGNACGASSTCADNKCGSWFTAETGGDPFKKCQSGTNPNANCVQSDTNVTCGSGGSCLIIINGVCNPSNGSDRTTPTVGDGGPCVNKGS